MKLHWRKTIWIDVFSVPGGTLRVFFVIFGKRGKEGEKPRPTRYQISYNIRLSISGVTSSALNSFSQMT